MKYPLINTVLIGFASATLILIGGLLSPPISAFAQSGIVVTSDTAVTHDISMASSTNLEGALEAVQERIILQYVDQFLEGVPLLGSAELNDHLANVQPRIILQYADRTDSITLDYPYTLVNDDETWDSSISAPLVIGANQVVANSTWMWGVVGAAVFALTITSYSAWRWRVSK